MKKKELSMPACRHPLEVLLQRSPHPDKKLAVRVEGRTVSFGERGKSDFTLHKDPERRRRYEKRHSAREDWTRQGLKTAGFWSYWLLWNKPSLRQAVKDAQRRFCLRIRDVRGPRKKTK